MSRPPGSVRAAAWSGSLSAGPVLDCRVSGPAPVVVRRWCDVAPEIDQVALHEHFVAVHLGGAKRLFRRGEGGARCRDVASGVHSIVPSGSAFRWNTQGPVDFAHLYVEPNALDRLIEEAFDRNPAGVTLREQLGEADPLIAALMAALLDELVAWEADPAPRRAYVDDLVRLLLTRVLRLHSNAGERADPARMALAPFRLKRAVEFIEAHFGEAIGVAEIAGASGISAFHFSRAFRRTTGQSPYAYLLERRLECAKALLAKGDAPVARIAGTCGFGSPSQFARAFRQRIGVSPTRFRNGC